VAKGQSQPKTPEKKPGKAKAPKTEKPKKVEHPAATEERKTVTPAKVDMPGVPVASTEPAGGSGGSGKMGKLIDRRNVKSTIIKVASVVVALVAVVILVFGILIYAYKSENPVVKAVAQVVPYPVQSVNGRFVSYKDYLFEVEANERAYQNNAKLNNQPAVDFTSADGKKLVKQIKQHSMQKLQGDALVAQLADQKKVKVTDKEVNDLINQLYQRYGGKDTLLKTLNQIYGWKIDDLKRVVRKQLLAKNLEAKVTSDPAVDATAKAKAQDVLKKIKDGGDFAALAKQYSQASDAANGGDLGFFSKGQLPDNVQAAAEALQPGQVSDAIKTQYGYEILKVLEKKDDGSVHAQHILIKTVDFNQYFQDELKKAKIKTYLKV
jgi:parvulin-like peptidyl-prolyl isomerase